MVCYVVHFKMYVTTQEATKRPKSVLFLHCPNKRNINCCKVPNFEDIEKRQPALCFLANELSFDTTFLGQKLGTIKFTPQGENLVMTETSIEEGIETAILMPSDSSYDDYCN